MRATSPLRIAFLHFAPRPGDVSGNLARIEKGVSRAAAQGADWVLTPELATSGYTFNLDHGVSWIGPEHDAAAANVVASAAAANVTLFLGMPERDADAGDLFNALRVVNSSRGLIGTHRKINTLRVGSEAWSSPGSAATTVSLEDFGVVGLLICADACSPAIGHAIKRRGARAIVSAANWAPGQWGPAGEWETMSRETGLPIFICNRTGKDSVLSFEAAETVIASDGSRALAVASAEPLIIFADWDFGERRLIHWFSQPLA